MAARRGTIAVAGGLAQLLGQATAAWSLVLHLLEWQNVSVWLAAPLVAAIAVPFRHDGSLRDRATANFGAAVILAGLLSWALVEDGLGGLIGGTGIGLSAGAMFMLASTVTFAMAGAAFWILRRGSSDA